MKRSNSFSNGRRGRPTGLGRLDFLPASQPSAVMDLADVSCELLAAVLGYFWMVGEPVE